MSTTKAANSGGWLGYSVVVSLSKRSLKIAADNHSKNISKASSRPGDVCASDEAHRMMMHCIVAFKAIAAVWVFHLVFFDQFWSNLKFNFKARWPVSKKLLGHSLADAVRTRRMPIYRQFHEWLACLLFLSSLFHRSELHIRISLTVFDKLFNRFWRAVNFQVRKRRRRRGVSRRVACLRIFRFKTLKNLKFSQVLKCGLPVLPKANCLWTVLGERHWIVCIEW